MRILKDIVLGSCLGVLLSSCIGTPKNPVLAMVQTQTQFAMVGTENRTDQHLMKLFAQTDSIIIKTGVGGEVNGIFQTLAYLDAHPEKTIVVDGQCASACTLLLSKPKNVVFTENATFLFHSAATVYCRNHVTSKELAPDGNVRMINVFPSTTQSWILDTRAFESLNFTKMDNKTARKLFPNMFIRSEDLPKLGEPSYPITDESLPLKVKTGPEAC